MTDLTLSALFDLFEAHRSPYVSPRTVRDNYRVTKRSVIKALGDRPVSELKAVDLLVYVQTQTAKARSPYGINLNIRVLRAVGRWAAEHELLPDKNPLTQLKQLKTRPLPIRWLSSAEFQAIWEHEHSQQFRDVYLFALLTGLRLGDVLSMSWSMVNLDERALIIVNAKSNKVQRLRIHSGLISVLDRCRAAHPAAETIWGRRLTERYVSRRFRATARRAHVEHATFHTMRKTFASWLVKAGVSIFDVQQMLGHSSPLLTARYYAALQPDTLGAQVELLMPVTGSLVRTGVALASSITGEPETLPPTSWQVSKRVG